MRARGEPAGDCIDCLQCVYVCPTGVDIRNGPNLGCIQCGLCIDACDAVMAKIDRPTRLIAYDTDINIKRRQEGKPAAYQIVRLRTALYAAIIAIVGGVMLYTLATRSSEGISVIHDRNPMFVRLSDGALRNAYTVRILNKSLEGRSFILTVEGLTDLDLKVVGDTVTTGRMAIIAVGPDQTHELRALVGDVFAASARGFDPADVPHHRRKDRATGKRHRPFPRSMRRAMSKQISKQREPRGGPKEPAERVTGRMVLICLVAFFAVVAGVNAVMIAAAVSTFGGVETEGSLSGRSRVCARSRGSGGAGRAALAGQGEGLGRSGSDAGRGGRATTTPTGRSRACRRAHGSHIRPTSARTAQSRCARTRPDTSRAEVRRWPASGIWSSSSRATGRACSVPRTASSCAEALSCRSRSIFRSS